MKNPILLRSLKRIFIYSLFATVLVAADSCKLAKKIQETIDTLNNIGNNTNVILDQAASDLNANADNFRQIMEETINKINTQSIKAQLQDALDNAIVTASTEYRCDISFTADYLIKRIKAIKASLNNTAPPVEEPHICNNLPSLIDMNLPPNQRNKVEITGYFLNEDFSKYKLYHQLTNGSKSNKTSCLTASSDFKLNINLGNTGIVLGTNSDKLVLTWGNEVLTEIPVVQRIPENCQLVDRTLTGLPKLILTVVHQKNICPNKGDKEFSGHGPCSKGSVSIFTRNDGRELWARGSVDMWECPDDLNLCRSDYTSGSITKELKLATMDSGWRIKLIKDTPNDWFSNIDRKTDQSEQVSGSGPVLNYLIFGDFNGDDIGSSRVEVTFKSIKVTLEEIGNCVRN